MGPDVRLRGIVVMMMVVRSAEVMVHAMMMARRRRKGRRRDQHQQKGSEHKLLHALRVAPVELRWKLFFCGEIRALNQVRKQA